MSQPATKSTEPSYFLDTAPRDLQQIVWDNKQLKEAAKKLGATGIRLEGPNSWSNPRSEQKSDTAFKIYYVGVDDRNPANSFHSYSYVWLNNGWELRRTTQL